MLRNNGKYLCINNKRNYISDSYFFMGIVKNLLGVFFSAHNFFIFYKFHLEL